MHQRPQFFAKTAETSTIVLLNMGFRVSLVRLLYALAISTHALVLTQANVVTSSMDASLVAF